MRDIAEIKLVIQELATLREVALAYSQIASNRINKEREFVIKNREFQGSIDEIFKEVISSYAKQVRRLIKKKGEGAQQKFTFLSHNGKTVAIFLSSNTGLYGDIVQRTFVKFMEEVRAQDIEVTIIGKLGLSLYLNAEPDGRYTYFELPDYGISQEGIAAIVKHIVQYERIHVYFGKFENIVSQKPDKLDISAETPLTQVGPEAEKITFLFEPTMEDILKFFEAQIFASQFDQVVRESQLAKFASRMLAMDKASENVKERIRAVSQERLRVSHFIANRKQLNSLAGFAHRSQRT